MTRTLPKTRKQTPAASASAAQGTDPQGINFNAASTVSYITSLPMDSATPIKMTEKQLNKQLFDMTPQERIAYATKLKAAGYSVGPINGAVTKNLRSAWLSAHSDLNNEILSAIDAGVKSGSSSDISSFLSANAGPSGGTGGAGKSIATSQINDTDAASIIDSVYKDLTGQAATPQDIAKHTKQIRAAQKVNPTTTVYDGTGKSMTTGGVNTQELVTQQLQGSDLVKEQRTRDAMTLAMQELGGLR